MTFRTIKPQDFILLTKEEIIQIVSATFTTKVHYDGGNWFILECDYKVLNPDNDVNTMSYKDYDMNTKIYLYLYYGDTLVRNPNEEYLKNLFDKKYKYRFIVSGENESIWLRTYNMTYSIDAPKKNKKGMYNKTEVLQYSSSMLIGGDVRCDKNNGLDYYSDLLIGFDILMKLKR